MIQITIVHNGASDNARALLPWFFLVNDRAVKVVETSDGGMDVLVLNTATGEFESDLSYLSAIFKPYKDVDHPTEKEFNAVVESMREKTGKRE